MSDKDNNEEDVNADVLAYDEGRVLKALNEEEEDLQAPRKAPPWLLTFGDIMALMLTFFVLLYSMSVPDEEQWEEFSSALTNGFSKFKSATQFSGALEEINIEKLDYKKALNLDYLQSLMTQLIESNEEINNVAIFRQKSRLILSLPEDLLFQSGKAEIDTAGKRALFVIGGPLSRIRNRIEVTGHTDPSPVSRTQSRFASNWELSLERAMSVAGLLSDVGYSRPIVARGLSSTRYDELPDDLDEETRRDYARRVDIMIMRDDGAKRLSFE